MQVRNILIVQLRVDWAIRKKQKDMKQVYDNAYIMKNLTQTVTLWRRCLALVVMSLCGVAAFAAPTDSLANECGEEYGIYKAEKGDKVTITFSDEESPYSEQSICPNCDQREYWETLLELYNYGKLGYVYSDEPIDTCSVEGTRDRGTYSFDYSKCNGSDTETDNTYYVTIDNNYIKENYTLYYGAWSFSRGGGGRPGGQNKKTATLTQKGSVTIPVYQGKFRVEADKETVCPGDEVVLTILDNNLKNELSVNIVRNDKGETIYSTPISNPVEGDNTIKFTVPDDLKGSLTVTVEGYRYSWSNRYFDLGSFSHRCDKDDTKTTRTATLTLEVTKLAFKDDPIVVPQNSNGCSYTLIDLKEIAKNYLEGCDAKITKQEPAVGTVFTVTKDTTISVTLTAEDRYGKTVTKTADVNVKVPEMMVDDENFVVTGTPAGTLLERCKYSIPDLSEEVKERVSNYCGNLAISQSPAPGTKYEQGASDQKVPVTITVKDGVGRTKTMTANVLIPASTLKLDNVTVDEGCRDSSDGTVTISFSGGTPNYSINFWSGRYDENDNITSPYVVDGVPAGGYAITLRDGNFCTVTGMGEVTQNDKEIKITGTKFTKPYDGTALTNTAGDYEVTGEDALQAGDTLTVKMESKSITNVGTQAVNVSYKVMRGKTADVTCRYNITAENGELEITPAKITVEVTGKDSIATYDGKEHSLSGYTLVAKDSTGAVATFFDVSKVSYSGETKVSGTNVGDYTLTLEEGKFSVPDDYAKNFNITYNLIKPTVKLTIKPAEYTVKITPVDTTVIYDGEVHTSQKFTASCADATFTDFDSKKVSYGGSAVASGKDARAEVYYSGVLDPKDFSYSDDNYNVTFEIEGEKKFGVKVEQAEVIVKVYGKQSLENIYNGQAYEVEGYTYEISDKAGNPSTLISESELSGPTDTKLSETNVGDYERKLTPEEFGCSNTNVKVTFEIEQNVKLEIKQLDVTVTITGHKSDKVYNGTLQTLTGYDFSSTSHLYKESDFEYKGDSLVQGTTVGTYTMELKKDDFENKNDNFTVTFEITNGELKITPYTDKVTITVTENSGTEVYDGKEHQVTGFTAASDNELYDVNVENIYSYIGSATDSIAKGTNVDTYDMNLHPLDFKNNNENFANVEFVIVDGQLEITPKLDVVVTIVGNTGTKIYDGTTKSVSGYVFSANFDGYDETCFKFTGDSTVEGVDVNVYNMNLIEEHFVNINKNFDDVTFNITDGWLEIIPVGSAIVIVPDDSTKLYDGTPLVQPSFTYTNGILVDGDSLVVEMASSITEVGSISNEVKSYKVLRGTEDVTKNYTFATPEKGTLTVTKRSITLTSLDDDRIYDGKPLKAESVTVGGDGWALRELNSLENGDLFYNFKNKLTDVGSVYNEFAVDAKTEGMLDSVSHNYNIEYTFGTLEILKRSIVLASMDSTRMYDATPLTYDSVQVRGDGFAAGEGSTYEVTGTITNVGSVDNLFTYTLNENTKEGNYNIEIIYGKLIVVPDSTVEVTIIERTDTFTYNGEVQQLDGYDYIFNSKTYRGAYFEYTGEAHSEGRNVGSYSMNVDQTKFSNVNPNYKDVKFVVVDQDLVIKPLTGVVVSIEEKGVVFEYDGEEHRMCGYTFHSDNELYSPEDVELTVEDKDCVSGTNVGVYHPTMTEEDFINVNPNFDKVVFNLTKDSLVITPKKDVIVTITEHSGTAVFDGKEHSVSGYDFASSTDLYTEDFFHFTGDSTTVGTNVGSYGMNLQPEDFVNDNPNFVDVQFVINHDSLRITPNEELTIYISLHGDTVEYDGNAHSVTGYDITEISHPSFNKEDLKFIGTKADSTATRTDVGATTMNVTSESFEVLDKNFTNVTYVIDEHSMVVTPRLGVEVTIIEHTDTFTYDGEVHAVAGYDVKISDPLLKEKDIVFDGTAAVTGTDAGSYPMNLNVDDFSVENKNFENVQFTVTHNDLVINPLDGIVVTITGKTDTVIYNGVPHSLRGYSRQVMNGLYDLEKDILATTENRVATGTVAGKYFMNLEPGDFHNINPNFTNVQFVVEDGYVLIEKLDVEINVWAASDYKTYDGTPLTNSGFSYDRDIMQQVATGNVLKAEIEGSITNVGVAPNKVASYKIYDADGNDVTDSYENIVLHEGELTILGRRVVITSLSAEKEYDGTPLMYDSVTVSDGIFADEDMEFEFIGSQTTVGSSENLFQVHFLNEDVAANYSVVLEYGTLTVNPNSNPIDIVAGSAEKYYDKTPLTDSTFSFTPGILAEGDSLIVTVEGSITEVGTEENKIVDYYIINVESGEDRTENYTFGEIINGKLEILYVETPHVVYGDKMKIIFKDVHAPCRAYNVLGQGVHEGTKQFYAGDYLELPVNRAGVYLVRILGKTIKVLVHD